MADGQKVWHRTVGGGNEAGGHGAVVTLSRRTDSRWRTNAYRQSLSAGDFMALLKLSTTILRVKRSWPKPPVPRVPKIQ
jgi:hypothetical protein